MNPKSLLDLNVLIALTYPEHKHHQKARNWLTSSGRERLGICPLTEAGFLRVTTNPAFHPRPRTLEQAIAILQALKGRDDYWYCPIDESWVTLTAPFAARIFGHQQVTDACLLGLAIKEKGVLVTFDKGIQYMAGAEFRGNVQLLE
ncbi:MAG: PIN domain-containing protein [Terracidiphilus sp.]|nr:PIN domain-containing protein [Terracidiphilus sp.]